MHRAKSSDAVFFVAVFLLRFDRRRGMISSRLSKILMSKLLQFAAISRFRHVLCLASVFAFSAGGALAQTAFVNFNTVGNYTNNFSPWNDTGAGNGGNYSFEENTTVGVGGSGGVAVFANNDMTATYNAGSWNLSTNGAMIVVSVLIYTDGQSGMNNDKVQLGIINSTTNGLNGNAGVAFQSFRFIPNSAASWSLYEQYRTGNNTTTSAAPLGTITIEVGHWYKFAVGVTNTSGPSGNLAAGCALFDYGTDGLTPGANLLTFSTAVSHAAQDIATNTAVWPALRAFQDAGISAWDNFVVYTSNSGPLFTSPLTNVTVAVGSPVSFTAWADGPGTISYAWYTNNILVADATGSTYTTPPVSLGFTNVTVVASNGNGSATNSAAVSVVVPSLPQVTTAPATAIGAAMATFNGQVISTGGAPTTVNLYYGTADGGTNAAAWANTVSLGLQSGAFSQTVGSLASNTTYFFTANAVNSAGAAWATPSRNFMTLATNPASPFTAVLTYHNDNTRMGVNSNETILTLANVNTGNFGRLFSCTVDGFLYAQPLIMTNVNIPGKGTHNVVYVATEHNSVYAFDADDNSGSNAAPLWQISFLGPNVTTVPGGDTGTSDITPEVGITSTPVIDPVTGTIYFEVKTKENGAIYVHRVHALDIATGLERTNFNSPVVIQCTNYPGTGDTGYADNDGKGHVAWNPLREHSRPALTLLNGVVYMSFASHGDNSPYHGWFFGYNATNLSMAPSVYNSTPNGGLGGFWDGGGGPSVDSEGNMYFQTGNGSFDQVTNVTSANNYAMSLIKFSTTNGLKMVDFFAPSDAVSLSGGDADLGSAGPIILPDSAGSTNHPHLVVGGGKTAPIYLVDRDKMGRWNASTDQVVQEFNGGAGGDRDLTPAFFNNTLYIIDGNNRIAAYSITNALFNTTPVETPDGYDNKGGATACISANGSSNAILWAIANSGADSPTTPAVLRAYNATNLTQELYASDQMASRDAAGDAVKFATPTIANGKVYVGAQYSLTVYGLASNFVATPVIAPNGGIFTNSVMVTLTDATDGALIYYTLSGTPPTTNSIRYSVPFVLTTSASVTAGAFKAGAVPSGTANASFLNSSAIGTGTGLLGQYWANTTSDAFITPGFNATPTLTNIDPTIAFDWNASQPAPNVGPDNYVVQWTGAVEPQFNETYTFSTTTDDGVLLYVNGQLLVNEWVPQPPTTWSGSINLAAQQRYNITMDYFQAGGGAEAYLFWSSPSTGPMTIIPQSQLYPVTNPPPSVVLTNPASGTVLTAAATVTLTAEAAAQYNTLSFVNFYIGTTLLGSISNSPYSLTTTGLGAGEYVLTAVAVDGSGLMTTSAPVSISVAAATGQPYGLTNVPPAPAFYNMPPVFTGALPATLSLTGVFSNTPAMAPAASLIPYAPNVPLFSDNAQKVRYFSVPNTGAPYSSGEQISYAPTFSWLFPSGTVFVKTFELQTNQSDPTSLRRLETRLLVRDTNDAVYGVTYKWRADNSDADLLTTNLTEAIPIQTPGGLVTNMWYYPSPSDCLQCHTAPANYVLGVNARQLNGNLTYSNGVTDNQLRALNRAGLLYPAIDESQIASIEQLYALTNAAASYQQRARSYLDANCAQCHVQPGGSGPTFDARYDIPLASQNIINAPQIKGNFGYDNVHMITPNDVWRSSIYDRMNSLDALIKMPPLARNLIDTNAVQIMAAWINSFTNTPALPPPTLSPAGGTFEGFVNVTLEPPADNVTMYYTLNGSLPTTNSELYSGPFRLTNSATVNANAWAAGYSESVVGIGPFTILPGAYFVAAGGFTNGQFEMSFAGPVGSNYVLQVSTNLQQWLPLSTNTPLTSPFVLTDPNAPGGTARFYRVLQQ
jgi:hypothetical protein